MTHIVAFDSHEHCRGNHQSDRGEGDKPAQRLEEKQMKVQFMLIYVS